MKKNKGFTLIELLAIIVILAIIAVITVPIILNIIENSKKGATTDSALGYKEAINKYYVSELSNNEEFELTGEYTVSNGVLNGNNVSNVEIPLSGTKPSSGKLHYTNNILDDGCLVIGDYKVTFKSDGSVNETIKGNCDDYVINNGNESTEPSVPEPVSFATDSWTTIKAALTADRSAYEIGSEKIIEFDRDNNGTNEYYKLRLVNTAACGDYTGSRTSCGVVIEFVTLIGNHNMNSSNTNAGGWYSSQMRGYLNTDTGNIFSKLPSDLQNVIIGTAPIVSGSGSGGVSDNVVISGDFTGDKLYLLSTKEVGFDLSYDNKKADTDTKILKYYLDNNSDDSRKKYNTTTSAGVDSTASWYWLRSARSRNADYFYYINGDGANGNANAYDGGGVAPAFRILD
jgi:prepilin-type N-terminal cleavage/methylation domain-containing protein